MSEFLKRLQEKEDKSGRRIRFRTVKSFNNLEEVIDFAFKMQGTESSTEKTKKWRSQLLGNSRSLQDLYLICKYYFPDTKIEDIIYYLRELWGDKNLIMHHCYNFGRMMFIKEKHNKYNHCWAAQTPKRYCLID